jgi:hypothetical protein
VELFEFSQNSTVNYTMIKPKIDRFKENLSLIIKWKGDTLDHLKRFYKVYKWMNGVVSAQLEKNSTTIELIIKTLLDVMIK